MITILSLDFWYFLSPVSGNTYIGGSRKRPAIGRPEKAVQIDLEQENFHQAHLYCFFRSPDGGAFSASAYVCVPGNGGQKVPEV